MNAITASDSLPLPRIDDSVANTGSAHFVTNIDLLKSYWQVILTPMASVISFFYPLAGASLTLNLAKCEFVQATIMYLSKQVGQGQAHPLKENVSAVV